MVMYDRRAGNRYPSCAAYQLFEGVDGAGTRVESPGDGEADGFRDIWGGLRDKPAEGDADDGTRSGEFFADWKGVAAGDCAEGGIRRRNLVIW